MMTKCRSFLFIVLLAAAGCLPLAVDADKKGALLIPREEGFFQFDWRSGKTSRLPWNGNGLPVYAHLAPNATDLLLASTIRAGRTFEYRLEIMPILGGESRLIYRTNQMSICRATISPDGKKLAVVQRDGIRQTHLPEIQIIDLATGKSSLLSENAGPFIHWLPDSKSLFTLQIETQPQGTQPYRGRIGLIDASDGTLTPLATVIADRRSFFVCSPDSNRVIFSAFSAGNADAKLDSKDATTNASYLLDVKSKTVTKLTEPNREVEFACYSPDGRKLLLVATRPDRYLNDTCDLLITDVDLRNPRVIARNAVPPNIGSLRQRTILPGWLDETTLYYFTRVNVYGTAGQAIHLRIVNADGGDNRDVQPILDLGVEARTD